MGADPDFGSNQDASPSGHALGVVQAKYFPHRERELHPPEFAALAAATAASSGREKVSILFALFGTNADFDDNGLSVTFRAISAINPAAIPNTVQCFIATATYGSASAREVETLRAYRERRLRPTWLGRLLIRVYERVSPAIARWVGRSELRRRVVRTLLNPAVKHAERSLGNTRRSRR